MKTPSPSWATSALHAGDKAGASVGAWWLAATRSTHRADQSTSTGTPGSPWRGEATSRAWLGPCIAAMLHSAGSVCRVWLQARELSEVRGCRAGQQAPSATLQRPGYAAHCITSAQRVSIRQGVLGGGCLCSCLSCEVAPGLRRRENSPLLAWRRHGQRGANHDSARNKSRGSIRPGHPFLRQGSRDELGARHSHHDASHSCEHEPHRGVS